jgi:lycopene cyclase domain-containing protein
MQFEYLFILAIFYLAALALKFVYKIKVFKNTKEGLIFYSIVLILGTIWDNFAVFRGHWSYSGTGIIGIIIGLIPIEDYFFALVCAYFLLVLYKVVQEKI